MTVPDENGWSRRGVLRAAVGTTLLAAASSPASAQTDTVTVEVGPNNEFVFTPGTEEPLEIEPGTTVTWVWKSDTHNIVADTQPEGANWEGHETIENTGFEYEHTFDVEGEYYYYCQPHLSLGMEADIIVGSASSGGGSGDSGGSGGESSSTGVPDWAETLGIATFGAMSTVLGLAFFFIKYGGDYDLDR